jgi:hypothetical protein
MPFVLVAVSEKVAMKLPDRVLSDLEVQSGMEDCVHDFGIASYFLLVAGGERLNFEIAQQALNVTIRQFASFDAGRRANAFYGRYAAQGIQSLWSQCAKSTPSALEFLNLGDESQQFRRDLDGVSIQHGSILNNPIYAHKQP